VLDATHNGGLVLSTRFVLEARAKASDDGLNLTSSSLETVDVLGGPARLTQGTHNAGREWTQPSSTLLGCPLRS